MSSTSSAPPSTLSSLLLLILLLACLGHSGAQSPSSSGPVITRISGCFGQNGSATFGCQFLSNAIYLSISGSGLDWTRQLVNISTGLCLPYSGTSSTDLFCKLPPSADYPLPTDVYLPVTVLDLLTG